jgi:murein DD-endopeptidase MepM/ murein hydrolase activator NlpD
VSFETSLQDTLVRLAQFSQRHRRAVALSTLGLLGGFGITAVAIAPLAPDASSLPQQMVTEAIEPTDIAAQLDALSNHGLLLRRSATTRSTDTVDSLFARLGVSDRRAAQYLRSDPLGRTLLSSRTGKPVQVEVRDDGSLVSLVARYPSDRAEESRTHFKRLEITLAGGQWQAQVRTVPYTTLPVMASGTIKSTLFAATDAANLPDGVAAQLAEIFAADIDFHRELRRGDSFNVVYESLAADGEAVPWGDSAGRVLAAEFVAAGRAHHAVWFTPADGRGGYFGLDGESRRRSFLASPVEFSRITSGFASRFHPIQQKWRQHLGVDYGAPTGTPVRAVGDGVVDFAGWQNGYGNVVEIRHAQSRETLYAHLSRIDVRKGQRIEQGQNIGAVGSTGWSTGPHLHFEFRVNGQHQDPLVATRSAETVALDAVSRQRFAETAQVVRAKLELASTVAAGPAARVE